MHYWFKPARFWKWFAAYYPASWQGWVVVVILGAIGVFIFRYIDKASHSISDTLINFVPWAIIMLLFLDLISLRTGEYPSWWRKKHRE